jgi:hypothetical protein
MRDTREFEPIHRAWHSDVREENRHFRGAIVQKFERFDSVFGFECHKPGFAQELDRHRAQKRFVLDDENSG